MATAEPSSTASHRILLINPPSPAGQTANREGSGGLGTWGEGDSGFIYPPQTLATTASVLRSAGWTVRLIDAAGERIGAGSAIRRVAAQPESIVAVSVAQISLDNDIEFINQLRTAMPRAQLLAIGASVPFVQLPLLERTDIDYAIAGEPEGMLLPVCRMLADKRTAGRLQRSVTAADIAAPDIDQFGYLQDLSKLPFPAWDLVPWQRYGFLTILTSRGCDDDCAFCPYVVGQGRRFRPRSAQQVVREMAWLAGTFHPGRVIVRDPVFARDRQHVQDICHGLLERKVKLAWECESRAEHFDTDLLRLMQRAGCTTIKIGLETTSEAVLRTLRRIPPDGSAAVYMQQTAVVVATCNKLGLACRLYVMTGLPGQSDGDVAQTIDFLRETRPTAVHAKPFHRYPSVDMPAADAAEERTRAERQAHMMQEAFPQPRPQPQRPASPLRIARRWLARRMQR